MKLYNVQTDYKVKKKANQIKSEMSSETKLTITRLLIAFILLIVGSSSFVPEPFNIVLLVGAYLVIGARIVWQAIKNIFHGEIFDENFLMSIATIGAIILKQYPEAIAVMLFYELGNVFEDIAVNKSKRSISALLEVKPAYATLISGDQNNVVDPNLVQIGDTILVKPGEKIPLDGTVVLGSSAVDTSALTGESMPQSIKVGDTALSGSINQTGTLRIKVTKLYNDSTVAKILDLVENASTKKADTEKFITKFAKIYTPIVVFLAVALAIVPSLMTSDWNTWIYRALIFLVISCPCALVISVPLSFFGGIGAASKQGILVKGSNYLEALNDVDTVAFDKTGTLTKGQFSVVQVNSVNILEQKLLQMAASVEKNSTHPIAKSILQAYEGELLTVTKADEKAGHGLMAQVDGQEVIVGNAKALKQNKIAFTETDAVGTVVYVAVDNQFWGDIVIADVPKSDAQKAIQLLNNRGIHKNVMLTGDNQTVGQAMARKLKMSAAYTNLLPENKVEIINDLLKVSHQNNKKVAFVGDGINDTPVLVTADIGFAMGGLGSDAAVEAADIVIMGDEPSKVSEAMKIAKKTRRIVVENISFALVIKILFLLLGALGMVNMWQAVFADVGVTIIAVLNAIRLQFINFDN
ncbi:heavy metal translocating P-type ATPase [Companilactobacillus bobalius]|uniref:Cd(2+)-exporting ATPase n=2 Tax=Companilactobacillus bobalius TaxID=2801451 RepID=A0A202FCL8_9LACO|nr:heavy metal translocating P-type ATPase [Companilactobacillus bobalius]GEO58550.1 zinc ABC transporter ATPase [Companilactobacillus paralimentarius]KAE9557513.1 zinc ABC transporter ATPase [Companilactobacillus bobalius]KAE9561584.1 zinc ABC transporter ATPase [Companilactobacillus bobalius]KAE9563660.1 zinc ABC transporter ATPase [Companilactobacillus bobalius]KRK82483.1 heavy metal-transporting ATPase [Companilactobacillus bobalius DSM 19674]